MDAKSFYNMWNASVESETQLAPLQVFDAEQDDDLLSLLMESDNAESNDVEESVAEAENIIIHEIKLKSNIFSFVKKSNKVENSTNAMQINPLFDSIQEFCKQYDYDFSNGITGVCKTLTNKELKENEAYCEILNFIFNIVIDCEFDNGLLQYSFSEIEEIIPTYRNFYLSELLTILSYKNQNEFDPTNIKYFSLEKRDTGLLLQLMSTNKFDKEEALCYTTDLDMFNSYLALKVSNKFEKELFDSINLAGSNLNSYTKSVLSDNPWAFLASNANFTEILKIVEEHDVPIDLAKAFVDNKWVYQIIKAYSNGLYSREFIERYLNEENKFADFMAEYYATGNLNSQALEVYNGDFYIAKFINDVASLEDDCEQLLSRAIDTEIGSVISEFSSIILQSIFNKEVPESEWGKFVAVAGTQNNVDILRVYSILSKDCALNFNQFCFKMLTKALALEIDIPADIGSLLLFQRETNLSYANTQMIAVCFDSLVASLKKNMPLGQYACILPAKTGILICQPDYNNFMTEEEKFKVFAKCKSSLDRAIEDGATKDIMKYNIRRIITMLRANNYPDISDSFMSLIKSPLETYLLFDDLLDTLANKLTEFVGLCRSTNAISLIKYLNSVTCHTNKAVIQIEFLKVVLKKFFGNRISFERYASNMVLPITVIEVQNSTLFNSESFKSVMYKFDDFVADLNRKNKIICRFSELSKIVITGV